MSTLALSTISNLAGTASTSSDNVINGSAKAWVNFNGTLTTPITPRASYNVTSVTKISTGNYTINMTNALVDTNYSVTGLCRVAGSGGTLCLADDLTARTTIAFRVVTLNAAPTDADAVQVNIAVFR